MTKNTEELISMVVSLPVDIKTLLVENILNSLYPIDKEIHKLWINEAEKRVREIEAGNVNTIPGKKVFDEIKQKYIK